MIRQPDTSKTLSAEEKRALLERMLREKNARARIAPLSSAQQRLWFADQLEPNSALYNIPTVIRLRGALRAELLQAGLNALLQRHAALRTAITTHEGQPAQALREAASVPWTFIDLSSRDVYERQRKADELVHEECKRPFDLAAGLMIRATLIKLSDQEHLLVIVTHHIASDEWSLRVLLNELSALYQAALAGEKPNLPELPIQYADYALWQQEWLKSADCSRQVAHWKEQLKGHLSRVEIPSDRPRSHAQTYNGALTRHLISKDTAQRLKALGRENGATLFMTLLAGFQALLHRYTGLEDVIVGSPIAGRTRAETEGLVGFFVNTLAMRARFEEGATFRELLQQTRDTTVKAYQNQDLPFDKLVEELHPERAGSKSAVVQVLFALNTDYGAALQLPGLRGDFIEVDTGSAKFDVTLVTREVGDGIEAVAEYNTDLFSAATIERLLRHFDQLLASAARAPDEPITRLEILTESERSQILVEWNATATEYPRETPIHALFDAQANKTPKNIAAEYQGGSITYRELQQRSNQLANHLLEEANCAGALIGLAVERSIDMLVGMLGILKAGAAYVPLDPSYPRERLALMIEDTSMPLLVSHGHLAEDFAGFNVKIISLDRDRRSIARRSTQSPEAPSSGEDLAYVIYTSGSTGKPKGVAVPHRGVTRLLFNTNYIQLSARDRIAQASNASFDAATFEIWGALLHGGKLVGIEKETAVSPEDYVAKLKQERVTAMFVTTALFNQLASAVPGAFDGIGTVMFGGEACDPKWVRAVMASRPPKRLVHVYGPTESTTFTTWFEVVEPPSSADIVPIGRPISNTQVYILDKALNPAPIGIAGELYVGGDGLAREYLKRPELTSDRFIPNPFGPPGTKLYRTGDLCRFRADGAVEFIGRVDHQVKIRGFRIELGEIECLLAAHPNVRECVVIAREDDPGEKRLAAYYVPRRQPTPTPEELRSALKEKLPDYMIPSAFVVLERLPLTPNGKIDRKALPAPGADRTGMQGSFTAPRTETERELAGIWEKVLGIQPVGVEDNFFDLGGHSLLAVRLFALIEKTFGKKLPLATLFKAPTISALAKVLATDGGAGDWSVVMELQGQGGQPPIFWAHSLGGDGGGAFFYYRKLAELLGPDQPSYGIRSPQQPFDSLEAMAAHYIQEIRRVQPEGPYYLGGFCFGGNVAYEMARQLREQGEAVGGLFLLESAPPPQKDRKVKLTAEIARYRLRNVYAALMEFANKDRAEQKLMIERRTRKLKSKLQTTFFGESGEPVAEPNLNQVMNMANYPKDYVRHAETHWKALLNFHPKDYGGAIHLFRAQKQPLSSTDPSLGWDALAPGRVRVTVVPGNHESIVQEPHVHVLARELARALEAARHSAASARRPAHQPEYELTTI